MSFVQNLTSRFYLSCDPSNPHQKNYRPHIDGLRAIAVLSVVGYHFFPNWVKGGFVGVDIFFVISGFLIGGILLDSLYNHSFSIKDFYARRVKRIFPALIVVLAATLAFGGFALLPEDFKNLGKHTVGGAGFIANLMFWKESGYFDVASEKKELLHLWSLGVEEQFYIIFPLLLWGLTKKNLRLVTFIVLLFVASFYWNLAVYKKDPAFDFYSPVTRFWELLAGVLLALWERRHREGSLFFRCQPAINTISSLARQIVFNPTSPPNNRAGALSSFVSLAGIVFIVIALYKAKAAGFPGKQALYPVLGAVCLIGAGSHALGNRLLLSLKPMVWIGLISYPLYLWHWPLITYARVIVNGVPSRTLRISLLLVAILLATLTYGFIEKPIRFGKRWRRGKIATLCAAMMVLAVVGAAIWTHHGYPNRWVVNAFETQNAEAFRRLKEVRERVPTDITNADHQSFRARYGWKNSFPQNPGLAMFRNVNGKHTTLLLGDSHAFHAYYAIADDNAAHGINTVRMGESWMFYKGTPEYVEGLRDFYFNAIKSDKSINKIFIMTFTINGVLSQSDIDALQQDGVSIYLVEDNPLIADPGTLNNNQLQEQCNRFLKTHHPLSAALFGNDHEVDEQSLPILNRSRADATKNYQAYLDVLRSRKNVTIIEGTLDAFCNETTCPFFDEQGMPLFWDDNHITVYTGGHRLIEKVLKPYLD